VLETPHGHVGAVPHFERPAVGPGGVPVDPATIAQAVAPPTLTPAQMALMSFMQTQAARGG